MSQAEAGTVKPSTSQGAHEIARPRNQPLDVFFSPTFPYPDTAARAFEYMWRYSENLRALYETPSNLDPEGVRESDGGRVSELISAARAEGRTILTEAESKSVLESYHIPVVKTLEARTAAQAVECANRLGYPVALKVASKTITHKTDVGGVRLNLEDAASVREAFFSIEKDVSERAGKEHFQGVSVQTMVRREGYELILGSIQDPQFGPVVLFGSGGEMVEVYGDRALALPPLNTTLARRLMEGTRIRRSLEGVRGRKAANLEALELVLVQFSRLVVEQPWIKEVDVNPLLACPEGVTALDARVILHGPDVGQPQLPRPAIQPYPSQYVSSWETKAGESFIIRPICPEDEPLIVKFHEKLSERSVYYSDSMHSSSGRQSWLIASRMHSTIIRKGGPASSRSS